VSHRRLVLLFIINFRHLVFYFFCCFLWAFCPVRWSTMPSRGLFRPGVKRFGGWNAGADGGSRRVRASEHGEASPGVPDLAVDGGLCKSLLTQREPSSSFASDSMCLCGARVSLVCLCVWASVFSFVAQGTGSVLTCMGSTCPFLIKKMPPPPHAAGSKPTAELNWVTRTI